MNALQIRDVSDLSDNAKYEKFRVTPPDKCLTVKNAHCGVWWKQTPCPDDHLGLIGHYYADNQQDSCSLLEAACNYLRDKGCITAVGPMDGNTWKPYRFVTFSDGSAPFLMEPQNPKQWPAYWQISGFVPWHEYVSTMLTDLGRPAPRVDKARNRLQQAGIKWRPIKMHDFSQELRTVYRLSIEAFQENVLYTPIDEKLFMQQYLPFADQLNPDYILMAEDAQGECCGFIFAVPDLLQTQRGEKINRLVIKTLAVHPGRRNGGLGAVLVDEVQKKALQDGLPNAIHALMYSKNNSTNIGKNSTLMRRYTLLKRHLT